MGNELALGVLPHFVAFATFIVGLSEARTTWQSISWFQLPPFRGGNMTAYINGYAILNRWRSIVAERLPWAIGNADLRPNVLEIGPSLATGLLRTEVPRLLAWRLIRHRRVH